MQINADKIVQVGMGFWASKTLLAANKLQLFTLLDEKGKLRWLDIKNTLGLNGYGLQDFLDALHSLGFLERSIFNEETFYSNTEETQTFLSKKSPLYIGGFLEMANDREYIFWSNLEEALVTGKPQNEIKETGKESFRAIYSKEENLRVFTEGMSGIQLGSFMAFSQALDFSNFNQVLDIGGSAGLLSCILSSKNPHLKCISYDLPHLTPFVEEMKIKYQVQDKVDIYNGDFFEDDFPKADLITMGNILHSFDLEKKKILLQKAYDALPKGGQVAVIEMILDKERKENTFGLLMSLNMIIESDGGFNFTMDELSNWAKEIGFTSSEYKPLNGPVGLGLLTK